jgi:hypothetical protein
MKFSQKFFPSSLIISYLFFIFFIVANITHAAPLVPCGTAENPEDCTVCDFFILLQNILNFLVKDLAMPIGVIVLIYGGVMMLTSGGSEQKISRGKSAIWFAVWGMFLAFAGWLIVDTIIKVLVDPSFNWSFGPWNAIPTCPAS